MCSGPSLDSTKRYRTPTKTWWHQRLWVECQVAQQRADMRHRLGATFAVIGKIALHPHTVKPHWFSIYSSVCSWNSAAQRLQRRSSSHNPSAPLGAAVLWGRDVPDVNKEAGVDAWLCARPGFICLALRVKGNATKKGQETNKAQAGDHLLGRRAGRGEVALSLSLTSISPLIHYRLYMSKRLPSVDSAERARDAFVRLLSPKGSATLPFLAANSKHCYLEWCISLCLPAGVDSPSPTQTDTHTHTDTDRKVTYARPQVSEDTHTEANANRHTNLHAYTSATSV